MDEEEQVKLTEVAEPEKSQKVTKILIGVFAVCALGTTSAIYLPASLGTSPNPVQSFLGTLLWYALLSTFIFKLRNRSKILGFVLGAIFGYLVYLGAGVYAVSNHDLAWSVRESTKNANADLPKMIKEGMRFDTVSISKESTTYTMNFTFINYASPEVDIENLSVHFKEKSIPAICADEVLKVWLSRKFAVNVVYHDKVGQVIEKYTMQERDCV